MSDYWIVKVSGGKDIKLDTNSVLGEIAQGKITKNNLVWKQGMKEWKKCVPETFKFSKSVHFIS